MVIFKLDRRMIPEEDPAEVEAELRRIIEQTAATVSGISVDIRRILLARALTPLAGHEKLAAPLQRHAQTLFQAVIPTVGTPLYTDVRLYAQHGILAVIHGASPRTVRESNAKRADEHIVLDDLRRARQVIVRTLLGEGA